jgi:hypothetical protein
MPVPDFYIVGAPKCGTTALYSYLKEHPGVFMPDRKELHYFCRDLQFPARSAVRDREEYLGFFGAAPPHAVIGEASASYLYSEVAVSEILRVNPRAKFIAILRNPVDMAFSFHSQLLGNLNEDIPDFPTAWDAQAARQAGSRLPKHCAEPKFLQYKAVCSFSTQIARLLQSAPREQVLVYIFEEFVRDPRQIYSNVLRFLGLPDQERESFAKVNANKRYRSMFLNRLLRRPPRALEGIYLPLKRCANAVGVRPRGWLERINSKRVPRRALDGSFRARLEAEFAPDIAQLEQLLGRPLEVWHQHA